MFFTPLYGVGIQDVPKLAKKLPQIRKKKKTIFFFFFLGVIDPLKRFLHLKMLNYAPK
jgi:hypothetical protein